MTTEEHMAQTEARVMAHVRSLGARRRRRLAEEARCKAANRLVMDYLKFIAWTSGASAAFMIVLYVLAILIVQGVRSGLLP